MSTEAKRLYRRAEHVASTEAKTFGEWLYESLAPHFGFRAKFNVNDAKGRTNRPRYERAAEAFADRITHALATFDERLPMDKAFEAMAFAREIHKDQVRKYTGNPYSDHLAEVAGIVATVAPPELLPEMVASAWLHDSIEDQDVTVSEIERRFGCVVGVFVEALSDLETGNRAERKAASRARLARAGGPVQTIKCADLISNTSSIVQHDPKFAKVYLAEKEALLDVMQAADPRLRGVAYAQILDARKALT